MMLENLKNQIINTDYEIMILIKRRLQGSKKLVNFKIKNKIEIKDEDFENKIIEEALKKSTTMDMDSAFISRIFEEILNDSQNIEKELRKKKENK